MMTPSPGFIGQHEDEFATQTEKERARRAFKIGTDLVGEEPQDMFIARSISEDGKPLPESFWLFFGALMMEFFDFVTADRFDICAKVRPTRVEFTPSEYDFKKATGESRLRIVALFPHGVGADLQAIGKDCDRLLTVFKKHFLGNTPQ